MCKKWLSARSHAKNQRVFPFPSPLSSHNFIRSVQILVNNILNSKKTSTTVGSLKKYWIKQKLFPPACSCIRPQTPGSLYTPYPTSVSPSQVFLSGHSGKASGWEVNSADDDAISQKTGFEISSHTHLCIAKAYSALKDLYIRYKIWHITSSTTLLTMMVHNKHKTNSVFA